jgi:molecular chaperone HtpG
MTRNDASPTAYSVRVGKDLLELVSSAMYVEPLTAYREYLQNAADSIDEARRNGLLGHDEIGRVEIFLDQGARTVRIRDNGAAIPRADVADRMLALGGSNKRGTDARGFRGVGRLAALGYAQYLTFRSRAQGESLVMEITWDGRRLRTALADAGSGDLAAVVAAVVSIQAVPATLEQPARFFEVEIGRIVRQRGDRLLDPSAVEAYIAQVAPVPFSSEFRYAAAISEAIRAGGLLGELEVTIDGGAPITRPHRDRISFGASSTEISEVALIELPGADGGLAAVGWFAHHDYMGAIPAAALVKGVRVRVGNIQVGDETILEQIFPEARFNSWTVGEVHIFDRRIVPNGRRDEFEANAHHANLVNQLSPIGREVARRCRTSSARRSKLKEFEFAQKDALDRLAVINQGAMSAGATAAEMSRVCHALAKMRKVIGADFLEEGLKTEMLSAVAQLETALDQVGDGTPADPLDMIAPNERDAYRQVFNLIYECSANRIVAKSLVDKIIQRLAA